MTTSRTNEVSTSVPEAESGPGDEPTSPKKMRRVATAGFIGTVVEFYDFGIYGTASALIFPQVFFPNLGPVAGTVASFATFGVAFVARPFGSILFGHFGDRLGRKRTLIYTLLMMGSATILVGLMPSAASIGIIAPMLVILCRVLQGIAAGGEWAGAVLFSSEHAPSAKRGFWASFPNLGGGVAVVLSNATFLFAALTVDPETFAAWGWRVPFLSSILLVVVGLWVRLRIDETPVFQAKVEKSGTSRLPIADALKSQPWQIVLGTGAVTMSFSLTYIGGTYLVSYGTKDLDLARTSVLTASTLGGILLTVGILIGARLSDRFGRRNVLVVNSVVAACWALALFPLLDTGTKLAFTIGLPVTMLISGVSTGPKGAFLSELFVTRYRYTAAGLSYSLGGVLGGAVPPLVASWVIASFGSFAFGILMAAICMVSLVCIVIVGETRQLALDRADRD